MDYRMVKQVKRKQKRAAKTLRTCMIVFAVVFVAMGIMISQGFMLPGFLMALLYFIFTMYSDKAYEYTLEGRTLSIDIIYGKRIRKEAHRLELDGLIVLAEHANPAVERYRRGGPEGALKKYDYTSYEENTPYYTMIIMENKTKIKLLLDLEEDMLRQCKQLYPTKVFLN